MTGAEPPAVILATTAPGRGGVWRHIEDLVSELGARGHRLAVALPVPDGELADAARALAVPVVGFWSSLRLRGWVWHGHLHDTYDRRFLLAVAARRLSGPVVLTEHLPRTNASDPALLPGARHPLAAPAKTAFKRLELSLADAVIAVSPSSAAFLRARYGDHGRVFMVANGIAPRLDGPAPRAQASGRALRVLSVGSVSVQKGHELLIDAAALAHEPWEVTVLGDGPARAALARASEVRGAPVHFAGSSRDVQGALSQADAVCLPSRWEAAPYAALEAMQAGLPLVATAVDGLRDLVRHERDGLLVPPEDPEALARALDRLAADASLRARLGAAATGRAGEFTRARMADETVTVYRAAIARRSPR